MSYHFQIRPVGALGQGYELSCEGVFRRRVMHQRLIEAVIHAVQVGHRLPGEIQVFDSQGQVAEVLPLRCAQPVEVMPLPTEESVVVSRPRRRAA